MLKHALVSLSLICTTAVQVCANDPEFDPLKRTVGLSGSQSALHLNPSPSSEKAEPKRDHLDFWCSLPQAEGTQECAQKHEEIKAIQKANRELLQFCRDKMGMPASPPSRPVDADCWPDTHIIDLANCRYRPSNRLLCGQASKKYPKMEAFTLPGKVHVSSEGSVLINENHTWGAKLDLEALEKYAAGTITISNGPITGGKGPMTVKLGETTADQAKEPLFDALKKYAADPITLIGAGMRTFKLVEVTPDVGAVSENTEDQKTEEQ